MAKTSKKNGFIVHTMLYEPIKGLSDEQLGRLFRALFLYQLDGNTDVAPDISMAFAFFKNQMDHDNEAWAQTRERRARAGRMRGVANAESVDETQAMLDDASNASNASNDGHDGHDEQCQQKVAMLAKGSNASNASKSEQCQQKVAMLAKGGVNGNVNGNVNVNVNGIQEMDVEDTPLYPPKGKGAPKKKVFKPPKLEEVKAYIAEKGYSFNAEAFIAYYTSKGWKVGEKSPMENWHAACTTWEIKRKNEAKGEAKAKRYEKPSEIGRLHVDMNPDKYDDGAW